MDTVLKQALGNAGTPAPAGPPGFAFDNTYARDLEGLYVPWKPAGSPAPRLLELNADLADELGLDARTLAGPNGLAVFAGNAVPEGAQPLAQAYAGHQFGGFVPQLGDGRALLLGELTGPDEALRDLHLKGSGATPFARGGDGLAAVGPMLREYIVSEAMHALGVPTTRALAVVATGKPVFRDTPQPGAVLARVAASHLRVGSFQYVAARGDTELLRRLADQAVEHGTRIAIEPMPFSRIASVPMGAELVSAAAHPAVGLVVDAWHVFRAGTTLDELSAAVPPGMVFGVELDDAASEVFGTLFEDTVERRLLCGEGSFDLPELVDTLRDIGFTGPWGVEILSGSFRRLPVDRALQLAADSARSVL